MGFEPPPPECLGIRLVLRPRWKRENLLAEADRRIPETEIRISRLLLLIGALPHAPVLELIGTKDSSLCPMLKALRNAEGPAHEAPSPGRFALPPGSRNGLIAQPTIGF
jgi:hypothetical protein